jgi:prolipoprotein diacylglyceryltransferase
MSPTAFIPSPSSNGFNLGPLFVHYYGLCYVVGITASVLVARKLWRERGGDPELVLTVALWGVPFGILGGRLYHDISTGGSPSGRAAWASGGASSAASSAASSRCAKRA